jgi:hypothetical protein
VIVTSPKPTLLKSLSMLDVACDLPHRDTSWRRIHLFILTCAFLAQGFVRLGAMVKNTRNSNKEVISVEAQARVHLRQHHFVVGKKSALRNSLSTIS